MESSETVVATKAGKAVRRKKGWAAEQLAEIDRLILRRQELLAALYVKRARLLVNYGKAAEDNDNQDTDGMYHSKERMVWLLNYLHNVVKKAYPDLDIVALLNREQQRSFESLNDNWS